MPLYPLGISRRRDVPSVPKQASGSVDMRWSFAGELACAFIDAPHRAIPPMLHATVLDAIHRRICVLPVRFGLAFRDETEIHSLLQGRHPELLDRLSYLDSTCEMGVQLALPSARRDWRSGIEEGGRGKGKRGEAGQNKKSVSTDKAADDSFRLPPSPSPRCSQSPFAYLEERRSFYRLADDDTEHTRSIVQQFVEGLHGYYRQWRKLEPTPSRPIRLAFLVERDCVTAFQNCTKNARRACREGRCTILGPWPPYSFC
jgi:hypothetical protein